MAQGKTFRDLCEQIEIETTKKVAKHPIFREAAEGSLPLDTFKRLVQQDFIYIENYYGVFKVMAAKESDSDKKKMLERYSQGKSTEKMLLSYLEKWNISVSAGPRTYTKDYMYFGLNAAVNSSVAESLAATFPCCLVWHKVGVEISKIPIKDDNPYKDFVEPLTDPVTTRLDEMTNFVNDYYERSSNDVQLKMLENYAEGVRHELKFVDGVYRGQY